jgi:hypothetical protein
VQSQKDDNLVAIRKLYEAEREARLQAERLAAETKMLLQSQQQKTVPVEDDDDDPYVDNKKLARKLSSFEAELEKKIEAKAEAKARALLEQEKQSEFLKLNRDFDSVMSAENLDRFAEQHPMIAENLLRMPNTFERQKLVYATIKSLAKEQEKRSSIQDVIQQKQQSPYYQPSGVSPGASFNGGDYSVSGQKEAYQKMQELKQRLRIG